MITLTDGTLTIELPADLKWSDEYSWQAVAQSAERTITGGLVVEAAAKQGGRPITLEPDDDSTAWIARSVLEQLRAWSLIPGLELTLAFHSRTFPVVFRHQDGGLQARPLFHISGDPEDADNYLATVRLMEI